MPVFSTNCGIVESISFKAVELTQSGYITDLMQELAHTDATITLRQTDTANRRKLRKRRISPRLYSATPAAALGPRLAVARTAILEFRLKRERAMCEICSPHPAQMQQPTGRHSI